ncbi:MAG: glycosyltransferase, partial [Dehalococcoidia bacterium]|nr:glycosyltransferase [Dehalococcoidia bacterium]
MSPSDPDPLVSVIIPAYNASATLPNCLAALQRQTLPPDRYEVIVVDDGSTDDTIAIAESFGVRVVRQSHENQAAARNRGAQAARGSVLVFTDADCEPAPDFLERMIAPYRDPSVSGVKGRSRTRQAGLLPRFIQQEFEEKYRRLAAARRLDFIDGYAASYRRAVFQALGGFDSRLPIVEDIDLSFRAAEHGHRLVFAPDAVVYHRHRETLPGYVRTKARAAINWVAVYQKHPAKVGNDSRRPRFMVAQIGLAGVVLGAVALAPFSRAMRWVAIASAAAFMATTAPIVAHTATED